MVARMETIASTRTRAQMESAYGVAQKHTVFKIAPVLADNSLPGQAVPSQDLKTKKDYPKPKGKTAEAQSSKAPTSTDKKKGKRQIKREGQEIQAFCQEW